VRVGIAAAIVAVIAVVVAVGLFAYNKGKDSAAVRTVVRTVTPEPTPERTPTVTASPTPTETAAPEPTPDPVAITADELERGLVLPRDIRWPSVGDSDWPDELERNDNPETLLAGGFEGGIALCDEIDLSASDGLVDEITRSYDEGEFAFPQLGFGTALATYQDELALDAFASIETVVEDCPDFRRRPGAETGDQVVRITFNEASDDGPIHWDRIFVREGPVLIHMALKSRFGDHSILADRLANVSVRKVRRLIRDAGGQ
jgi:hypothetical protein